VEPIQHGYVIRLFGRQLRFELRIGYVAFGDQDLRQCVGHRKRTDHQFFQCYSVGLCFVSHALSSPESFSDGPPHDVELSAQSVDARLVRSILQCKLVYLRQDDIDASLLDAPKPHPQVFPLFHLLALIPRISPKSIPITPDEPVPKN
jgi:hypothetical protein